MHWFGLFFSPEVGLRPYTPTACLVTILWVNYKVEAAVELESLPVSACVPPQLLLRSLMRTTRTCWEVPSVQPALMSAASEIRECLMVKLTLNKRCLLCVWSVCVCLLIYVLFSWFNSLLSLLLVAWMWLVWCLAFKKCLNWRCASRVLFMLLDPFLNEHSISGVRNKSYKINTITLTRKSIQSKYYKHVRNLYLCTKDQHFPVLEAIVIH